MRKFAKTEMQVLEIQAGEAGECLEMQPREHIELESTFSCFANSTAHAGADAGKGLKAIYTYAAPSQQGLILYAFSPVFTSVLPICHQSGSWYEESANTM